MSYCFNPKCPKPDDSININQNICSHCGSQLLLQNRYRGVRLIGQGAFGKTIEITDNGIPKVLKILCNNSPKAIDLFQREARVLQQLHHPGIPQVDNDGYFTIKLTEKQRLFHCIVMEKITGENLEKWLNDRHHQPINQNQACQWLKQLVEILEKIHQQQYFHRDIKPSNIMLKTDGQLVLIDFGAVREVSDTYLSKIGGGRSITNIGSAGYKAPEQTNGKALPQSDFFALGRTFVHLLTGKHPIDLEDNPKTGELIWRNYAPQVSKPLADLIDYLMNWIPGNRPKNTQIILEIIENIIKGKADILENEIITANIPIISKYKTFLGFNLLKSKIRFAVWFLICGISINLAIHQIANYLHTLGYKYYMNRDYITAEFYLKIALIFNSKMGTAHYNLGAACDKQKKYECARNEYEISKGDRDDNTAASAINNLGRLDIAIEKNYDQAINLLFQGLQRANQIDIKSNLYKNIGWAYLEKADYIASENNLEMAINLNSKNASAYCLLAQLRETQKDKKGAMIAWENCHKYGDPNNPDEQIFISQARQRIEK